MEAADVIEMLRERADPAIVERKKKKFGVAASNALGVYQKELQRIAKEIGTNSQLAESLFDTGIYEARLLCSKLYDPADLTDQLMEHWVATFDNWEICDSFCMGLFAKSELAQHKAQVWSAREEEFVKRAAFAIMAAYGFSHKDAANNVFEGYLALVERESTDDRRFVMMAVNWALRSIGKRNADLHQIAVSTANRLRQGEDKTARWVGSNAIRQLEKPGLKLYDYPRSVYRAGL